MEKENIEEIELEELKNNPKPKKKDNTKENILLITNIILGLLKFLIIYLFAKGNIINEESNTIINNLSYVSGIIISISLDIITNIIIIKFTNQNKKMFKYYELLIYSISITIVISLIMLIFK